MVSQFQERGSGAHKASSSQTTATARAPNGVGDTGLLTRLEAHERQLLESLQGLEARCRSMETLSHRLEEVALATRMVAFNAAIEASRAQAKGGAFGVVADEVGALAARAGEATRELTQELKRVFEQSSAALERAQAFDTAFTALRSDLGATAPSTGSTATRAPSPTPGSAPAPRPPRPRPPATASRPAPQTPQAVESPIGPPQPVEPAEQPAPARNNTERFRAGEDLVFEPQKMSTGFRSLDEQHERLIRSLNHLNRMCQEGKALDEIEKILDFLGNYVAEHFAHEEQIMSEHNCAKALINQTQHKMLVRKYTEWRKTYDQSGGSLAMVKELNHYLRKWLVNHICGTDACLKKVRKKA